MTSLKLFLTAHVFPSVKGSSLFLMSWFLNLISVDTRNWILWVLTVIVTCYAIYDFHLKVQYKRRSEKKRRLMEAEEAKKQFEAEQNEHCNGK